jgi:hypothetical protein
MRVLRSRSHSSGYGQVGDAVLALVPRAESEPPVSDERLPC